MTASAVETSLFPLYARYPRLATSLPRLPLHQGPSPVAELTQLGGKAVWIKNDGLYGTIYGGNKPRKLELVLPDVRRTGATSMVSLPMKAPSSMTVVFFFTPSKLQVMVPAPMFTSSPTAASPT